MQQWPNGDTVRERVPTRVKKTTKAVGVPACLRTRYLPSTR